MTEMMQKLSEPFAPELVSWRVGSTSGDKKRGLALAYIDARDVMARLDEVVGPENWQRRYPWSDGKRLCCDIGIRIGGEWVWKGDGAGETDVEAEKGAFSDAFKRAAVSWGIGRYLYDLDSPWVELEPAGRSFKIKESEYGKLVNLLHRHARSQKATPSRQPQPAPKPEPQTVGDMVDDLPPGDDWDSFTDQYKRDFLKCRSHDDGMKLWNNNSKTLSAFKAASKERYDALYNWLKTNNGHLKESA